MAFCPSGHASVRSCFCRQPTVRGQASPAWLYRNVAEPHLWLVFSRLLPVLRSGRPSFLSFGYCMVRPLKTVVLLLSVHPRSPVPASPTPTRKTDLPTYLPQAPLKDCSYQRGSEGRAPLLVSLETDEPT